MSIITGQVFNDLNGNQSYDLGIDVPLAGVNVVMSIGSVPGGTEYASDTTAADGTFSLNMGGADMSLTYCLEIGLDNTWDIEGYYLIGVQQNYQAGTFFNGENVIVPMVKVANVWNCTRIAEKWVRKVCFNNLLGIRVTFASHAKKQHQQKAHHQHQPKQHKLHKPKKLHTHIKPPRPPGKPRQPKAVGTLKAVKKALVSILKAGKGHKPKKLKALKGLKQKQPLGVVLFTCIYPNTTSQEFSNLLASPDKGSWIHQFFFKKRMYYPCPTDP